MFGWPKTLAVKYWHRDSVKAKEEDDDVDPDVTENLLGKKAVNWRYK